MEEPKDWRSVADEENYEGGDPAEDNNEEEQEGEIERADLFASAPSVSIMGDVTGRTVAIAESIVQNFYNDSTSEAVHLSRQHFRSWSQEDLGRCEAELIIDESTVERLGVILEENRLLVLHGEPEVGKGMTTLLVAARLRQRQLLKGVLSCQSPDSGILVDLDEIASSAGFRNQLILLEDAIAGENSDLLRFLGAEDSLRIGALRERLRGNGAFLVLTAASGSLAAMEKRLSGLKILVRVEPPPTEILRAALGLLATRLPNSAAEAETLDAFLAAHGEGVAQELGTVPRIARFVQEYLSDVVTQKLPLKQALDRLDNLAPWLLSDLAGNLEARGAVLALVVGSAVPPANAVPWFPFDRLRRALFGILRRDFLSAGESEPVNESPRYLERARAHAVAMPAPLSDMVRFRDDRYPVRLWRILLGPGREISTLLLPLLRKLTLDSDPYLRSSAARALGRIGQIGPMDVASPAIEAWAAGDAASSDLLGWFLQGAMASEDPAYRDFCLSSLRRLTSGREAAATLGAVRGLRMLGRPDPTLPLRELRRVALARLPIQTERLRDLEREVGRVEGAIRGGRDPRNVTHRLGKLHAHTEILLAAKLVPEPELPLLAGLQHSLAGVLFSQGGDPGPVLAQLSLWMIEEREQLSPLLAFLFLHRQGLFDLLDRHKWFPGSFTSEACSRFLLSGRQGQADRGALLQFVERIAGGIPIFPGIFSHLLTTRLLQVLRRWAKEGCAVPGLRPVVLCLLAHLLEVDDAMLRGVLFQFLKTDPDFCVNGSRLRALAIEALTGAEATLSVTRVVRPVRAPNWFKKDC
jgi:HEAT repeat protein